MALGPAVYKLIFDTQGLESVTASRRELALQKKIMEETAPAADKLAQSEANLDRLVAKGLITSDQKTAALKQIKDEMSLATDATDKHVAGLHRMALAQASNIPLVSQLVAGFEAAGPAGVAAAVAFTGISAAISAVGAAADLVTDKVAEQVAKMDDLINRADSVGLAVNEFERLAMAADMAGVRQEQFANGMEKMLRSISKADMSPTGERATLFAMAGLDADKLKAMRPEEAFENVVAAINKIPNAADRARVANEILGSPDFLRVKTEHIERATEFLEKMQAEITPLQEAQFREFGDSTKDLTNALDLAWRKLAIELVPAISDAADAATEWLTVLNQSEDANALLRDMNDIMRGIVAATAELARPDGDNFIDRWVKSIEHANPKLMLLRKTLGLVTEPFAEAGAAQSRSDELDIELAKSRERLTGGDAAAPETKDNIEEQAEKVSSTADAFDRLAKSLEDQRQQLRLSAREYERWKMVQEGLEPSQIDHLMRIRDSIEGYKAEQQAAKDAAEAEKKAAEDAAEAAKKRAKEIEAVNKLATDTIKDLEKEIRQSGMTESEKKIDNLREKGVSEDQLAIVKTLQDELDLRKAIHSELDATSGVMKANSREAADAFAKANQLAVRRNFFGGRSTEASLGEGAVGFTATAVPGEPVLSGGFGDVRPPVMTAVPQTPVQETNKLLEEIKALLQQQVRQDERTPVVEELTL